MRSYVKSFLLLLLPFAVTAQDTTITISPKMIDTINYLPVLLSDMNGWTFKRGNDAAGAKKDITISDWEKRKPTGLLDEMADKSGKIEGWFRIKIKLDTSFRSTLLNFNMFVWAASEVYLDEQLIAVFGNTGANGKPFKEHAISGNYPVSFNLEKGTEHTFAIHFVDFLSPLPPYHLKSKDRLPYFLVIANRQIDSEEYLNFLRAGSYRTVWISVNVILCLLFWLLTFQNRAEKNIFFIAITCTLILLYVYCVTYWMVAGGSYIANRLAVIAYPVLESGSLICGIVVMRRIFSRNINALSKILLGVILICGVLQLFTDTRSIVMLKVAIAAFFYIYYITTSWKTLKGAQWAIVVGIFTAVMLGLTMLVVSNGKYYVVDRLLQTGIFLSFPLSLLVYVAMRFKEIIEEVRDSSQRVVQLSEEKKQRALNQQKMLQEEVNRQTAELRFTLDNLRSTQAQLIQSEKMASLGELTAGIAHEIQNPLNFVNNFSDVNKELLIELKGEADKGNIDEVKAIANDVIDNQEKITHHGQRADAIVKGMLQHSRTSTGKKEPTDINALADEYLRLAYHGMRAKDKDFNANFKTDFDESLGKIEVVPQDIGRVLLNLYNNAFYAASLPSPEKIGINDGGFKKASEPTVWVTTKREGDKFIISVRDNGPGIPSTIIDKIFQPFFTTKPTGEGTGLGLSLTYDIVKAHEGEIKVESVEGEGSDFIIELPIA